jgi:hypothetical protein
MRSKRALILQLLLAAVALILSLVAISRSDREEESAGSSFTGLVAEYNGGVCEVIVDMGYVAPSSLSTHTIRIVNASTTPLVPLDYTSQCRCMWLDFERQPIAVGESFDMVLTFDSRGEWGEVGNYIEIATSNDSAPIVIWISAEIG